MAHDRHSHDKELPDVSHISNEDTRHEESDVRIRPIAMFMVWLTVAAIVIHLLMAGLYKILEAREESKNGPQSPMAAERNVIPPEPRLQLAPTDQEQGSPRFTEDHPLTDMRKLRAEESERLNGFGWVDQRAGVAKIPIEDAKHLLLQSGALKSKPPAQTQSASQTGAPQTGQPQSAIRDERPSRSSSGRRP